MSTEVKRCTQCGMLKDVDQFRKYTYSKANGTDGRFRVCRSCEAVNSAYKRICAKLQTTKEGGLSGTNGSSAIEGLLSEKAEIEKMYDLLDAHGLRTPKRCDDLLQPTTDNTTVDDTIKQLTTFYAAPNTVPVRCETITVEVPEELQAWLDADPAEWAEKGLSPEYLQETIYESLKAKYRPQTGVDHETYLPIYDDTYKDVLNKILRKFDDYEESYAGEADE